MSNDHHQRTTVSFPYFDLVLGEVALARASGNNVLPLPLLHQQVRDEVSLSAGDLRELFDDADPPGSRLHHRELCLRWFYECAEPTEQERAFLDRLVEMAVKQCV